MFGLVGVLLAVIAITVTLIAAVGVLAAAGQVGVRRARRRYGFTEAEADEWSHRIVEEGNWIASQFDGLPPGETRASFKRSIQDAVAKSIIEARSGGDRDAIRVEPQSAAATDEPTARRRGSTQRS
jgi:hypothetical protein